MKFGLHLRALRLGFRIMEMPFGPAYVRIRADGPPWVVDVGVSSIRHSGGEHVCWWDGEHLEIMERIYDAAEKVVERIGAITKPTIMVLDDNGNLIDHWEPMLEGREVAVES